MANTGHFPQIKASCTEHQKGTIAISLSPRPSTVSESSPICISFLLVSRTRRCRLLPKALVPTTKKLTAWLTWYIISTCTTSPLPVLLLLCRFLPFMIHIDYSTVHLDSCFRCHWQTTPFQLSVYHVRVDCSHWPMLYTCDLWNWPHAWPWLYLPWLPWRNCYNFRISGYGECVCVVTNALLTETAPMSGQERYSREPRSAFTSHAVTHFVFSAYLSITGRFNFSQRVARWRIVSRWASNAI